MFMQRLAYTLLVAALSATGALADSPVRFRPVEVYIDSGAAPLAAYQIEIVADGDAQIVGVEGGETRAFAEPPRYDPKALAGKRIILAAFDTGSDLPRGRTRVATIHLREPGTEPAHYRATLEAAAGTDGQFVAATVELVPDEGVDQ